METKKDALMEQVGMGKIPDRYLQTRLSLKGLRKAGTALTRTIHSQTHTNRIPMM